MSYVVVRVWVSLVRSTSPGHASLAIHPHARTPSQGYVSFAPRKQGSIHGPGEFFSLDHDLEHYSQRGFWAATIHGLDTEKMLKHFIAASANPQIYSIRNECATQVHHYLKLGGGDDFASAWSSHVVGFWSPDDVEQYAKSIAENTSNLGSHWKKVHGEGTVF